MTRSERYRFHRVKLSVVILFVGGFAGTMLSQMLLNLSRPSASAQSAQFADKFDQDFDTLVRGDFFAGMTGDRDRLERAMKNAEAVLARNPKHAQALVWHGGGLLARATTAYRKGDSKLGDQLWQQGLDEMDQALSYAPDRIDVIIGRSATIIGLAQAGWDPRDKKGRELLESALLGYEKVYRIQKPTFNKVSEHSRGELLFGLASGWSILGEHDKSQRYLRLITEKVRGTDYETEARRWLGQDPRVVQHDCRGCHVTTTY